MKSKTIDEPVGEKNKDRKNKPQEELDTSVMVEKQIANDLQKMRAQEVNWKRVCCKGKDS